MADRDAHLTDPAFRDIPVARLLDPAYAAELAARIDPRRAAGPARATNPSGGGTVYLAVVDRDGNAVSLIQSLYWTFGSGVLDPDTGVLYQNRGSYFSLDPAHPNVLEPGKRTLHTLLPGMLFRDGVAAPWVVAGAAGGDAQPQVHAQLVSALVDGGVDLATAVAAPRWFVEPAAHFEPPVEVRLEPRHATGIAAALEALGHPVTEVRAVRSAARPRARDRARRRRAGARRRLARGRHRPAQRRAAGGLVTAFRRARMRYSRLRWRAALTRRRHRSRPRPNAQRSRVVSSNVGQNYPYTSETEAERAARIATPGREARRPGRRPREPRPRRSTRTSAGGSGSARRRAARASSTPPATRPRPRGLGRLRRDLRQDLPALSEVTAVRHRRARDRGQSPASSRPTRSGSRCRPSASGSSTGWPPARRASRSSRRWR